jgi:Tfp pilus assembly protein PilN
MAAAAQARLVAAVTSAAEEAGWRVRSVAPAESAWAGAARSLWPAFARQPGWVVLAQQDRIDLLQLEHGRLVGVRRFRSSELDAHLITQTVGAGVKLGVIGSEPARRQFAAEGRSQAATVLSSAPEWRHADDPGALAAEFAGREAGPVLRSEDALSTDHARGRHMAWLLGAAAAGVLALAAGVELWGVHRQLRLVREEREKLRPQIMSTLNGRTTIDATSRHLASLGAIERGAPHWSAVITELSQTITDDAYLTAIRARGDSLIIDGLAEHASRVFDALQRSKMLTEVRSAAPVRREIQDDGTALDHFTISARVAPPPAPAPATTPAAVTKPASASRAAR